MFIVYINLVVNNRNLRPINYLVYHHVEYSFCNIPFKSRRLIWRRKFRPVQTFYACFILNPFVLLDMALIWSMYTYTRFFGFIQVIISKFQMVHTIKSVIIFRLINHVDKRTWYVHYTTSNLQGNEISLKQMFRKIVLAIVITLKQP